MEWNTVERAIQTKIDTRTEKKRSGQARLVYVKNINGNIPTTWRWAIGASCQIHCRNHSHQQKEWLSRGFLPIPHPPHVIVCAWQDVKIQWLTNQQHKNIWKKNWLPAFIKKIQSYSFRQPPTYNWYKKSWINCLFFCFYVVRSLKKKTFSKSCTFCPISSN